MWVRKGGYFMKRFKKILFVNDEKTTRTEALERAVNLALSNEAALTLVEALENFPAGMKTARTTSDMGKASKNLLGRELS